MKNLLIFENEVLDDSYIFGGVKFFQEVNTGTELTFGTVGAAQVTFNVNNVNNDAQRYLGKSFIYKMQQSEDVDYRTVGIFNVTEVVRNGKRAKIVALDNVVKLGMVIDEWLSNVPFPITLVELAESLCNYCGLTLVTKNFTNSDAIVMDNITGSNIAGRVIMQWIAQEAACFVSCDILGRINLNRFVEVPISINNTHYVSANIAEYEAEPIDKVQVQLTTNDIGVVVGDGTNALVIQNNALLYAETDAEIREYVTNIYNAVREYVYTPMTISLLQDFGINCGDIIRVNGIKTMIMKKQITASGIKLESIGKQIRDARRDEVNEQINALRGRYNILKRDLETTIIELGNAQGDISSIKQNIDSIELSVLSIENVTKALIDYTGDVSNDVTELDKAILDMITEIRQLAEIAMTSEQVTIKIREELINTGVDNVETGNGFTFDKNGLTLDKVGSMLRTIINENGMIVKSNDTNLLVADKDGVQATNLSATTYLTIGKNSRFEDYNNNRTGCFWIGQKGGN